jgi:bZIP transcription factor
MQSDPCSTRSGILLYQREKSPPRPSGDLWHSQQSFFPTNCYTNTMAYYANGQWPAVQTSTWPDPALHNDWQNLAMNGGSPESSSVSLPPLSREARVNKLQSSSPSQGYYEPMDVNTSSYAASSYSQGAASSSYAHHSEAPSTSYLTTTADDFPYYFSGDTTYDPSALTSPTQYSSEPATYDYDPQYDMAPEPESSSSSGRRKSSSNSSSSSKQKRQLQNRLAQRAFRERQAKQQEELHKKVRHLKEQYEDLEGKYQQLRGEHERCRQKEHRRDCNCGGA